MKIHLIEEDGQRRVEIEAGHVDVRVLSAEDGLDQLVLVSTTLPTGRVYGGGGTAFEAVLDLADALKVQ